MKLRLTVDVSIGKVELMTHRKEEGKREGLPCSLMNEGEEGEGQAVGYEIIELLEYILDSLKRSRDGSASD